MTHDEDDAIPADLANLIAELPDEIQPETDLWDGIRSEITPIPAPERPATSGMPGWASVAAWMAAGVAAAAAIALMSIPLTPTHTSIARVDPAAEPIEAVEQWEADVRQTTDELLAVLQTRRNELDPEAVRVVERALVDIDSAIADVRRALADDPENDALEAALAGVYQRKVELLRSAADLPAGG